MFLSTLELALCRCGTLELELFRCGRVVPMEGGGVEELVDGYRCFGGGRVVEIEDESCIDAGRSAGAEPARQVKSRCGNGGRGGAGAKTRGSE